MKSVIRNIFPGGNTPFGFHSYYNHILPQKKAKKIFCLKGGPGVGKSTLMKRVGDYYEKKDEDIDYYWCSADPESLDGVLLKNHDIAIIDGTAPHIVDPQNPGAVDQIVDMGRYLDKDILSCNKKEILEYSCDISEAYKIAYAYLQCAYITRKKMSDFIFVKAADIYKYIWKAIFKITAETNMNKKDNITSSFFASAITSSGIINHTTSLIKDINNVIFIDTPVSCSNSDVLYLISLTLATSGYDVEKYYCPMDPLNKIEHIICRDADLAILTNNAYHKKDLLSVEGKTMHIWDRNFKFMNEKHEAIYEELYLESDENINKAIAKLNKAKCLHDDLEKLYIQSMDFSKVDKEYEALIDEINRTIQTEKCS